MPIDEPDIREETDSLKEFQNFVKFYQKKKCYQIWEQTEDV